MFGTQTKESYIIYSPVTAKVGKLSEIKDEAFASGIMGEGVALYPMEGVISSPCDGEIEFISITKHAIGIRTDYGFEILLHIGLRMASMDGRGFRIKALEGERIKAGKEILEFDLERMEEEHRETVIAMVMTDLPRKVRNRCLKQGDVKRKERLLEVMWERRKLRL